MNEKDPQPKSLDYVDVLDELKHGDFFKALATVNDNLQSGATKDEEVTQLDTLLDLFGDEYINGTSRVFAELHQLDKVTGQLKDGEYLSVEAIDFCGFEQRMISETPVVVCEFYDKANETSYYVDPRTFFQLEIAENDDISEDIQQRFKQYIATSVGMLRNEDFLLAPFDEQQGLIGSLTEEIASEMNIIYDKLRVEIDCVSYYNFSDNDKELNLDAGFMDQSEHKYIDRFTPSGIIVGSTLLEQLDTSFVDRPLDEQAGYVSADSFNRSGGIPCLIVRDPLIDVLYFIQLDAIRNITCDQTVEDDDDSDE